MIENVLENYLVIVALIFGLIIYFIFSLKRKKVTESFKEVCSKIGLFESSSEYPAPLDLLEKLNLFTEGGLLSTGVEGFIHNLMEGRTESFKVAIFDKIYEQTAYETSYQTVILFKTDQFDLPKFRLRPTPSTKGINFKSFPKFSQYFYLVGKDEEKIRSVFNDRVLSCFENHIGWFTHVEGLDTCLVFYKPQIRIDPDKIREFYEQTHKIAQAFLQTP